MSFSKKERAEYNVRREHTAKELGLDKNKYNALRRVSHELRKHGTDYANVGDEKSYHKGVAGAFAKAEALRKKLGGKSKIHFHHQTDPRGVALYASKKRIGDKDYNSAGHPIY